MEGVWTVNHPLAGARASRRQILALMGAAGAATIAGGGTLAACSKDAGSTGTATAPDKIGAVLPKYIKFDLVPPDLPGTPPVANGYLKYPTTLVDAVSQVPGTSGQKATAMTPWWGPIPPGLGSNAYYDAVNAELGVPLDFSVQDGNTYADKLNAILGARDVPDLLCVPSWEIVKVPRFSDAVKALFEDLTDYLKGDAVAPYAMLASLPTGAWQNAVWGGRLSAIPWPTDGPFPWALFHRKDLFDAAGLTYPKSLDELYSIGKEVTKPDKGVWAFNDIFAMVQMFHKVAGSRDGWRRKADGNVEFKYETPEYRAAVEYMARIFKDGLVHPDLAATEGADQKQLFRGGKILFMQDGVGAWQGMQAEESKVTPTFNMQPVPIFAVDGGPPLVWGSDQPIFYTFIKKGLGKARTEELLRVLNWAAAPFGTKEWELREYGKEGTHFTRDANGAPVATALAQKEIAFQYGFVVGRMPAIVSKPETPNYVRDLITYSNAMVQFLEKDPWVGIKLEMPANYSKVVVPTEEKITDIIRGRRPVSDLDGIVNEWRNGGGNEGREFLGKALTDAGR
jgi:putative aldouronate transport system substrate-binding protein